MTTKQALTKTEIKNAILMIAGQNVSLIGTMAFSFALGLYVLNQTGSPTSFALTLVLSTVPRIVFSPFAGLLTDKFNKKHIVVIADFLSGIVVLSLLILPKLSITAIYIVIFLLASINTFLNIAFMSAAANLFSDRVFLKINGLREGSAAVVNILAPVMGGFLYALGSIYIIILINALSFILSAISELFIDFNYNVKALDHTCLDGDHTRYRTVINYIIKQRGIAVLFVVALFLNFAFAFGLQVPLIYLMNNILHFPAQYIGMVEGAFSIGALIGALYISARPFHIYNKIFFGTLLTGFIFIAIALPFLFMQFDLIMSAIFLGFMFCLIGAIVSIINIPVITKLQQIVPQQIRGKFMSVLSMTAGALVPIALVTSGLLVNYLLPQYLLITAGFIVIIVTLILFRDRELAKVFSDDVAATNAHKQ